MIRYLPKFALIFIFLIAASAKAAKFSPVFISALEFGGDKLIDVTYTDGSKSNIEAGRGIILGGGVNIDLTETKPHTFEAQATLGIKWTSTKQATNGSVDWYRFPLELISFYRNTEKDFRIGGGLVYQFGNELKGSKDASNASVKFDNSTGYVIEGDYFVGAEKNITIGFRYTGISYIPQIAGAGSVNGNSYGFNFNFFWP
jgi:hypothetical protein